MEFNKSVIGHELYGESGAVNPNLKKRPQPSENEGVHDDDHPHNSRKKKEPAPEFKFYDPHLNELLA